VTGGFGEEPEVVIPDGRPDNTYAADALETGDGATVAEGDFIVTNYAAYLWPANSKDRPKSGEPLFDTFAEGTPRTFTLTAERSLPGMVKGLAGATVGSRMLLVLPPEEAFGEQGQPDMSIGPKDTVVFVFDLLGAFTTDQAAAGAPVEPDSAFPTITEGEDGPTASMPPTEPPTELSSQVLVKGTGATVEAGQLLVVQYRGQLWKDGSEFDSSWASDSPTAFPIGTGNVIAGWDRTLVGQTIGSRVLLVVPPADGYGEAGRPPTIAGDDTLVFIVDILGAYGDPAEPTPEPTESPTS
jgi:peptidylprolyl isomerase